MYSARIQNVTFLFRASPSFQISPATNQRELRNAGGSRGVLGVVVYPPRVVYPSSRDACGRDPAALDVTTSWGRGFPHLFQLGLTFSVSCGLSAVVKASLCLCHLPFIVRARKEFKFPEKRSKVDNNKNLLGNSQFGILAKKKKGA